MKKSRTMEYVIVSFLISIGPVLIIYGKEYAIGAIWALLFVLIMKISEVIGLLCDIYNKLHHTNNSQKRFFRLYGKSKEWPFRDCDFPPDTE